MAKITKQRGLLLVDEDNASNYSDKELLIADGVLKVKCSDTETNMEYEFDIKVEVSMDKGGTITPLVVENSIDEIKMLQSVAETIQIVLLQRIEAEVSKTAGQNVNQPIDQHFLAFDALDQQAAADALAAVEDVDFRVDFVNE